MEGGNYGKQKEVGGNIGGIEIGGRFSRMEMRTSVGNVIGSMILVGAWRRYELYV